MELFRSKNSLVTGPLTTYAHAPHNKSNHQERWKVWLIPRGHIHCKHGKIWFFWSQSHDIYGHLLIRFWRKSLWKMKPIMKITIKVFKTDSQSNKDKVISWHWHERLLQQLQLEKTCHHWIFHVRRSKDSGDKLTLLKDTKALKTGAENKFIAQKKQSKDQFRENCQHWFWSRRGHAKS